MALFEAHFRSNTLGLQCSVNVILPDRREDVSRPLPCLWLLHGLSDDHTIWLRRTSLERYLENYQLAVVMPAVDRSFYADMQYGLKYWTYLSEELPDLMRQYFPLSARREDNFAAGLSMGGYGAFKLALNHPERFAAAASLSGALDLTSSPWSRRELTAILQQISDKSIAGTENDLFHMATQLASARQPQPRLFQWCGTQDFLYKDNLRFRDHARTIGLQVDYSEGPGGHSWDRWDEQIQQVLAWLGAKEL